MTDPTAGDPDDPTPTTRYAPPAEPESSPAPASPPVEPASPPVEPPSAAPAMATPSATPSWHPVRAPDQGRTASVLFGFVILAIGLWLFADQTLGLELPRILWGQLWPIVLIVIGAWIAIGSMRRGSR